MTHEDAGKYKQKHPAGAAVDASIAAALEQKADAGRVTCKNAEETAGTLSVALPEVGKNIDLLEYRIIECQLGLFGYEPHGKAVEPAESASDELRAELDRFGGSGEISCASSWEIADRLGLQRMAVAAACELLHIKIRRCQLGAF